MRESIYYWKCDSPLSVEAKKKLFFKEKYASPEFLSIAAGCIKTWNGETPSEIMANGGDGNHFAFIIKLKSGEKVFLRGDEGGDDDYMMAETAAMKLADKHGVPVPKTLFHSTGEEKIPVNFQILELIERKPLDKFHKDGSLDIRRTASQLGAHLKILHNIKLDGFGFFNTRLLKGEGKLRGLLDSYADYFHTKLDEHLSHLEGCGLLTQKESADIQSIFRENEDALKLDKASLTHRDAALWNILGTASDVESIVDWDDCVAGEPADELGMLLCLYRADFMRPLLNAYADGGRTEESFIRKIWLHMLRNMLWKAKLRESLGYFTKDASFFLNLPGEKASLKDVTLERIRAAVAFFKSEGRNSNGIL